MEENIRQRARAPKPKPARAAKPLRKLDHDRLERFFFVVQRNIRVIGIDFLVFDRSEHRIIQYLHTLITSGLQLCRDLVRLVCH